MNDNEYKKIDFDNPSYLFILEDKLKGVLGGPFFYNPYIKSFKLKGNEMVLDFGCGGGVASKCALKFLNQNGHITAVDVSNYWVKKAKKRLKKFTNVDCIHGDIRNLDIPDSSFDVIFTIHVIHDIPPKDRQTTVNALSRKLKKGGRLLIRDFTKKSHGMPIEKIRKLLSNAGLKEVTHTISKSEYMGEFQK